MDKKKILEFCLSILFILYVFFLFFKFSFFLLYLSIIASLILLFEILNFFSIFTYITINEKYETKNHLFNFFYLFHLKIFVNIFKFYINLRYNSLYPKFTVKKLIIFFSILTLIILTNTRLLILYTIYCCCQIPGNCEDY